MEALAATKPKLGRGRPSSAAARKAARQAKRIEQKVGDLFQHRYLFVQHVLTPAQRRTLMRITRRQPELRTLRGVMDEVYRRRADLADKAGVPRDDGAAFGAWFSRDVLGHPTG